MASNIRQWGKLAAAGITLGGVLVVGVTCRHRETRPAEQANDATATTKPAAVAATTTAGVPEKPSTGGYLDAIRAEYPKFAATQPLGVPVDLPQAAHFILQDPIYLSTGWRQEMWITRGDAPPTEQALKDAANDKIEADAFVVRERTAYVHWMPRANGPWAPILIGRRDDGEYDAVSADQGRRPLPRGRGYHWDLAMSWNEKIVVPTAHGVSILRFDPDVSEIHHELLAPEGPPGRKDQQSTPRVLLDRGGSGLIAWLPWENGKKGGVGAAEYVESSADENSTPPPPGKWTDLTPAMGWPAKILQLVPLDDGSVLLLAAGERGAVEVQFNTSEHASVNEEKITALVYQLSDPDEKIRKEASDKLSLYGPGIWPILEKLQPDQGPEGQARIKQLLKQRATPSLNGMILLGKKSLQLMARLSDGGTVFYAEGGVSIPDPDHPDEGPRYCVPAWIAIRPNHAIALLDPSFTADLVVGQSKLFVNGSGDDWIITNDPRGARRYVFSGFVSLLRKSERDFTEFVGTDGRGRWIFRKAADVALTMAPATFPATGAVAATHAVQRREQTLIIDPTLPDPTPRLPVWVFTGQAVGWTAAGWPVAKKDTPFDALHENGWEGLPKSERVFTDARDVPPPVESMPTTLPATALTTHATSRPARAGTTAPTTTPSAKPAEAPEPILTDRDGNRYYDGRTSLRVISRSGKEVDWRLPPLAEGTGDIWLVRASDDRLYLFNQAGRVVRIKPTPNEVEPFTVEKIFTHRIPTVEHPTRIWLDPAGRIVIAWGNQLAFLFPQGFIPSGIVEKMVGQDMDEVDE